MPTDGYKGCQRFCGTSCVVVGAKDIPIITRGLKGIPCNFRSENRLALRIHWNSSGFPNSFRESPMVLGLCIFLRGLCATNPPPPLGYKYIRPCRELREAAKK